MTRSLVLAFALLGLVIPSLESDAPPSGLPYVLLAASFIGYFTVSYRVWGRTPGMMLGRLYVIHVPTGEGKLAWGTALGRTFGLLLGYFCGIATIIWLVITASSPTKQGPHDSWAKTGVLRARPQPTTFPLDPARPIGPGTTSTPPPRLPPSAPPRVATTSPAPALPALAASTLRSWPRRGASGHWVWVL